MKTAPFVSARLVMRQQSVDDAPALHEAYRNAEVMRWWSSAPHATIGETVAYLTPRTDRDAWRGWTVRTAGEGRVVGTLAASLKRPGVAEIGYLLLRDAWGQGFAREGVARLIDLLIREEGCRRVFADVDPNNTASVALLERLGFRQEGRLRAEWETHIGVRDSLILGLLADEWISSSVSTRS